MSHAKNKIRWCVNKATKELEQGSKHRGLVKIAANKTLAIGHIAKAEHSLRATFHLKEGGFDDWCTSTLFYTMYHCCLAVLALHGYESCNQECTFAVIQYLQEKEEIDFPWDFMEVISPLAESPDAVVSIREKYQYSVAISLEGDEYETLLHFTKDILSRVKVLVEK